MRIQSINCVHQHLYKSNNKLNNSFNNNYKTDNSYSYNPVAYRDYNISFGGRTPDDFYAQDFNRDNMPDTMKDYLYDDYEHRQFIPPEQMMKEVYKYLEIADNFDEVKSIYPNENLFRNLHVNNTNSRNSVLAEINIAKELSSTPLFKDGSDDFGMYLLRKIYLEGKTLGEINKDFFEKDINDEYKGFITKPIVYQNLDSFGISYPNNSFWHSFISTREEYKKYFVSLPKISEIPGVNINGHNSSSEKSANTQVHTEESKKPKRRYSIKPHRKREIQKDIIDKKGTDTETVRKIVTKRFGKDDPEASFIVRYMSPIMTIAAERAHMSEELKAFAEYEKEKGKSGDEKTMFARFWKHNPKMLEVFSYAVTDTMDMFEDIYGEGGLIAINTDLEKITPESEKKKIIDFVNPQFLDLLNYTQTIEPERTKKYELHDLIQKQWEEHFNERYANSPVLPDKEENTNTPNKEVSEAEFEERLKKEAQKNNANVYKLRQSDGNYGYITSNLNEVLRDQVKSLAKYLPTKYAQQYIKSTLAEDFSERYKLTLAVSGFNLNLPEEQQIDFDDEILQSRKEHQDESYKLVKFHFDNAILERAARFAILDTMLLNKDINLVDPEFYNIPVYNIDDRQVADDSSKDEFNSVMQASKKMIDRRYDSYSTSLIGSDVGKVMTAIFNCISNYNPEKTILEDRDTVEIISMMKDAMPIERNFETYKLFFSYLAKQYPFVKSLILKGQNDDMQRAKFEVIMEFFNSSLIAAIQHTPDMMTLFNSEVYNNHRNNLSPQVQNIFDFALTQLSLNGRMAFFTKDYDKFYEKPLLHFTPDWAKDL